MLNPTQQVTLIFLMNKDAQRDQGKHIALPVMRPIEAYNMMLKEYGEVSWSECIELTAYQDAYDSHMAIEAGVLVNYTDLYPKLS